MDISKADISKAISIVEESRRSHETWIIWYQRHPEDEARYTDTCGETAWHQKAIDGYDHVLKVLKSLG